MKRKHKFRNSDNSRKEFKEAEKKYKKQMDTSIRKYRQKMKKELKTLRSKNPKEYWKILNKGQKKKQPNISIDVLYEFLKNLYGAPDHDDVELSILSESLQENLDFDNLNIYLNDSITRYEILTCIKK
jgi:vacuolar-type H+-ATPase subunit H